MSQHEIGSVHSEQNWSGPAAPFWTVAPNFSHGGREVNHVVLGMEKQIQKSGSYDPRSKEPLKGVPTTPTTSNCRLKSPSHLRDKPASNVSTARTVGQAVSQKHPRHARRSQIVFSRKCHISGGWINKLWSEAFLKLGLAAFEKYTIETFLRFKLFFRQLTSPHSCVFAFSFHCVLLDMCACAEMHLFSHLVLTFN